MPAPSGRQKKPLKYCRDGEGRYEAEHGVTCTELGPHKVAYERVFGRETVPGIDLEQLDTNLEIARELLAPVGDLFQGLIGNLTGIEERLDDAVAQAFSRAEAATAEAAEADNLRRIAERERDEALNHRQEALTEREDALRDLEQARHLQQAAEAARDAALQDKAAAEAARSLYAERAERSDAAAERDRIRVEETSRENAELAIRLTEITSKMAGLDEQLRHANERAEQERTRAERAVADTEALRISSMNELDRVRNRTREQLDSVRAEMARLTSEHMLSVERLAEQHGVRLAAQAAETAAAVAVHDRYRRSIEAELNRLIHAAAAMPPQERAETLRLGIGHVLSSDEASDVK